MKLPRINVPAVLRVVGDVVAELWARYRSAAPKSTPPTPTAPRGETTRYLSPNRRTHGYARCPRCRRPQSVAPGHRLCPICAENRKRTPA